MENSSSFNIFSPYIVEGKSSSGEVDLESLKEMAFRHASKHGEVSVGKQILERGSVIMHNEMVVVACCVLSKSDEPERFFVVTTPGADGGSYWLQNLEFLEVNDLTEGINKTK